MESFCGVGSSELLLFQEESLVCSLADMAGLVDAGVDLVGKDGLVCIVEHRLNLKRLECGEVPQID
jgi:hypothetical protein